MKVRYFIEAKGELKIDFDDPINMGDYIFTFSKAHETGCIKEIVVEISNIPQENWPTLTKIEPDPTAKIPQFPFAVNRNVARFATIRPHILALEGYLSIFGLASFEIETLREEWVPEPDDPFLGMQSGFSMKPGKHPDIHPPLSKRTIAQCIALSGSEKTETGTLYLGYFRIAQINFLNRLYIDSIRYSYFCLESLFANGKFKKAQVLAEFSKSDELNSATSAVLGEKDYRALQLVRIKYASLSRNKEISCEDFYTFLVELRGKLQHANEHPSLAWHPSHQTCYENEALCIFNLAADICYARMLKKLDAVATRVS